jgi:abnormal spindle-like microcephaly-associated protein
MKLSLEHFIKKSFISDESTLQKFTKGRFSVLSGKWETKYKEEMRNLVLARIMILVFFLDRAKASNVLENVPRLFTVSSNVKSTRDVLLTITRDCLSAEGDIVKHLSRIGLKISYVQDPVDEVNFRVTNLATDLRDGVLLTRLSEIVAAKPFKSCMSSLRLPVISRLQKKFNVNMAFSVFKDFGIVISDEINAHHVMDGHKEMVLALMWCIIGHSCLEKLLQGDHVEQEIKNVIQSSLARKKLEGKTFSENEHLVLEPSIKGVRGKDFSADEILQELLLRWSRAVCSSFGLTLDNLSGSFANGEALCMLVHYYHPSLIPINDIFSKNPLSDRYKSKFDLYSEEEILAKEHQNWERASKSMLELGGIPDMLPICDSKNPPNEKSMLLCLSYLCSRLMESSNEIFATILIQACYRKYRSKVLMEKKMAAASTIFRIWTRCKSNYFRQQEQQFKGQVAILENFVLTHKHSLKRMKKARLEREQLIRSVTTVQVSFCFSVLFDSIYVRSFPHYVLCLLPSNFLFTIRNRGYVEEGWGALDLKKYWDNALLQM